MTTLTLSPMFPRVRMKRRSRAFGLLEVILVFAIVIGAAAVTFTVFSSASASSGAAKTADQLNLLAANLRASPFGLAHDYTGLSNDSALKGAIFPANLLVDGKPNTDYGLIQTAPWYKSKAQFDININNIPQAGAECTKLLMALGNSGYDDVIVGDSDPGFMGGDSILTGGKLDMSKVTFWCSGDNTPSGPSVGVDIIGH
ncbi:hypothetical protein ASG87_01620 [Frateuria sp. Soil773]|uniref:type 4 pilus major pilin n=1 Tax=Frateuria sp. Soil773 TaxID=1736407 RepID=UPI0006FAC023|nr:type 4 pilus major pilin [Frateuria sp. Soil773]KRE90863.1 hypothetical protein ASG87_01620 [Frateuria sp. Soil773]